MRINWTNVLIVGAASVIYSVAILMLQSGFRFSPSITTSLVIGGCVLIGFVTGWTHPVAKKD